MWFKGHEPVPVRAVSACQWAVHKSSFCQYSSKNIRHDELLPSPGTNEPLAVTAKLSPSLRAFSHVRATTQNLALLCAGLRFSMSWKVSSSASQMWERIAQGDSDHNSWVVETIPTRLNGFDWQRCVRECWFHWRECRFRRRCKFLDRMITW